MCDCDPLNAHWARVLNPKNNGISATFSDAFRGDFVHGFVGAFVGYADCSLYCFFNQWLMLCFAPRLSPPFQLEKTPAGIPRHYAAVNARLASGGCFPSGSPEGLHSGKAPRSTKHFSSVMSVRFSSKSPKQWLQMVMLSTRYTMAGVGCRQVFCFSVG
jgi:hypothetical protein